LLWAISIHRLDSEHGVDAALDELVVDVRVDRDDAPPVTATGRARLGRSSSEPRSRGRPGRSARRPHLGITVRAFPARVAPLTRTAKLKRYGDGHPAPAKHDGVGKLEVPGGRDHQPEVAVCEPFLSTYVSLGRCARDEVAGTNERQRGCWRSRSNPVYARRGVHPGAERHLPWFRSR
jgi:hypothetical protein